MTSLTHKIEGLRKGELARTKAIDHDIDKINAWNDAIEECLDLLKECKNEILELKWKGIPYAKANDATWAGHYAHNLVIDQCLNLLREPPQKVEEQRPDNEIFNPYEDRTGEHVELTKEDFEARPCTEEEINILATAVSTIVEEDWQVEFSTLVESFNSLSFTAYKQNLLSFIIRQREAGVAEERSKWTNFVGEKMELKTRELIFNAYKEGAESTKRQYDAVIKAQYDKEIETLIE